MKIDYNFHSHTARCGHAYGEDEEYVIEAIEAEIKYLGFSDHVILPNIFDYRMRGEFKELPGYIDSVNSLKTKYSEKIHLYLAFECEYDDHFVSYYQDLYKKYGFDYLILGQHSRIVDGLMKFYASDIDKKEAFRKYTNDIIKGIKSGLFLYVCHPDVFRVWYREHDKLFYELSEKIIKTAIEYDLPLELNMGRSRVEFNLLFKDIEFEDIALTYPDYEFWALAKKLGAKVTFGIDSHAPKDVKKSPFSYFDYFIKKLNLDILPSEEMVKRIEKLKVKNSK